MADLKAFAEQLVNLTVKEVNELAKILKDEYGIEPAAAAVAVAAPAASAAPEAETNSVWQRTLVLASSFQDEAKEKWFFSYALEHEPPEER